MRHRIVRLPTPRPAHALDHAEVLRLVDDFVAAAVRSEQAGFDGVEIHGAHGYVVAQFLSPEINRRTDEFGGSLENRSRLLFAVVDGIRKQCGRDFLLGVRLSPERFGLRLGEMIAVAERLLADQKIDFLDMSLWDVFKESEEEEFRGRTLMSYFTELERGAVRLGVAGKIRTPENAERTLAAGADWVMLGRAAIVHHDFPNRYAADSRFVPAENPVTRSTLPVRAYRKRSSTTWPDGRASSAKTGVDWALARVCDRQHPQARRIGAR